MKLWWLLKYGLWSATTSQIREHLMNKHNHSKTLYVPDLFSTRMCLNFKIHFFNFLTNSQNAYCLYTVYSPTFFRSSWSIFTMASSLVTFLSSPMWPSLWRRNKQMRLISILKTLSNREWKITFSYIRPQNSVQNLERAQFILCGLNPLPLDLLLSMYSLHYMCSLCLWMFTSESESESGLLLSRFSHTKNLSGGVFWA